jgi:hypothetical protein
MHGREQIAGIGRLALVAPEPGETESSPELPRFGGLLSGDLDRMLKRGLRCINLGGLGRAANRGAVLLSLFKRRRFPVEIILLCVRWYCKYGR